MSGQTYGRCCQTVHADIRVAREPAQVVRPRYSARVLGRMEFFRLSISREFRDEPAMDEVAATIGRQRYESIRIIAAKRSGWLWRRAAVDCRSYEAGRKQIAVYAERVHLKREARAWRVVMVELIAAQTRHTPGHNAPCPCGSGKKYKRCCGDHAEALTDWTA